MSVTTGLDVFPARLDGPGGVRTGVRVLIDGERLLAFASPAAVDLDVAVAAVDTGESHRAVWTVLDADGGTWTLSRSGGCGCGSPLRRVSADALRLVAGG